MTTKKTTRTGLTNAGTQEGDAGGGPPMTHSPPGRRTSISGGVRRQDPLGGIYETSFSKMTVGELEEAIRHHNRLYFEENRPVLSDYEFDRLVRRLKKLKPDSPVLVEIPKEKQKKAETFPGVRHTSPMLSLDKCYTEEDAVKWAEKFEGDIVASPKIDGCAMELRYDEGGRLVLGATRGDGIEGEDVTANVKEISDIPKNLPNGPVEIRGEVYMKLSVFKKYEGEFANPRNLAAGALKQKDPKKTHEYNLSFFGYDVLGVPLKTEGEKFEFLRRHRIPTVEMVRVGRGELQKVYENFLKKRDGHDYETDGVVFKADRLSEQERLGATAHHPRYAIAYKFQGDEGVTRLVDVEWSVARTGVITPVGIVEPVELSGATVTRVSLHNYGLMKKLGLRRGAKVLMVRRGGVIPNLETVVEAGEGEEIRAPRKCTSCGSDVKLEDDFLYCTNAKGCRKTKMGELEHFVKTVEIDGFGDKLIERLYENGFVKDTADFYKLKEENLLELERMGEVLAAKLIGNVQNKRELSLDAFLRSLGISELAKHVSKILAENYKTLDGVLAVKEEELAGIHTIGEVIAKKVVDGLREKKRLIDRLLKFVMIKGAASAGRKRPLAGKSFLFTGKIASMDRATAEKRVEELGGIAAIGGNKELDYLVVGDEGSPLLGLGRKGSKFLKAEALQKKGGKVKIISEGEFMRMIKTG